MSKFNPQETSSRSDFCNSIFSLIVEKNNFDIDLSLKEAEPFFDSLDDMVRNVYELIDSEIPLWRLHELLLHKEDHGNSNWDYSKEEYDDFVEDARNACEVFYCTKKPK